VDCHGTGNFVSNLAAFGYQAKMQFVSFSRQMLGKQFKHALCATATKVWEQKQESQSLGHELS
jgi:hypothetical protein